MSKTNISRLVYFPQSLDSLLEKSVGQSISQRLAGTQNPTQIAQIITNLEYLQVTCVELGRSLTNLRLVDPSFYLYWVLAYLIFNGNIRALFIDRHTEGGLSGSLRPQHSRR